MPANLPPDYYAAERRYRQASSIPEKIEILKEMLALMPKYKGTEHLQGDLKRRIAKLGQSSQKQAKGQTHFDHIPKEGAAQAVLVGPPNAGKSTLLCGLTNAKSEIAEYPFSTFKPVPGMMEYEDIQIQLIDLPPVSDMISESWIFSIIRLSDLVVLVLDLSADPLNDAENVNSILKNHKIVLQRRGENVPQGPVAAKSTMMIGNKKDTPGAETQIQKMHSYYSDFPVLFCSFHNQNDLFYLRQAIFDSIHVIRVYTKLPGRPPDLCEPTILPEGTNVYNAALSIHRDLADRMIFARIWGSEKYQGQRVEKDHILKDKDIIEIHH